MKSSLYSTNTLSHDHPLQDAGDKHKDMRTRQIEVDGFKVEVHRFGNRSFLYPSFNGNAEFRASSEGFKQLRHYLRTVKFFTPFQLREQITTTNETTNNS